MEDTADIGALDDIINLATDSSPVTLARDHPAAISVGLMLAWGQTFSTEDYNFYAKDYQKFGGWYVWRLKYGIYTITQALKDLVPIWQVLLHGDAGGMSDQAILLFGSAAMEIPKKVLPNKVSSTVSNALKKSGISLNVADPSEKRTLRIITRDNEGKQTPMTFDTTRSGSGKLIYFMNQAQLGKLTGKSEYIDAVVVLEDGKEKEPSKNMFGKPTMDNDTVRGNTEYVFPMIVFLISALMFLAVWADDLSAGLVDSIDIPNAGWTTEYSIWIVRVWIYWVLKRVWDLSGIVSKRNVLRVPLAWWAPNIYPNEDLEVSQEKTLQTFMTFTNWTVVLQAAFAIGMAFYYADVSENVSYYGLGYLATQGLGLTVDVYQSRLSETKKKEQALFTKVLVYGMSRSNQLFMLTTAVGSTAIKPNFAKMLRNKEWYKEITPKKEGIHNNMMHSWWGKDNRSPLNWLYRTMPSDSALQPGTSDTDPEYYPSVFALQSLCSVVAQQMNLGPTPLAERASQWADYLVVPSFMNTNNWFGAPHTMYKSPTSTPPNAEILSEETMRDIMNAVVQGMQQGDSVDQVVARANSLVLPQLLKLKEDALDDESGSQFIAQRRAATLFVKNVLRMNQEFTGPMALRALR